MVMNTQDIRVIFLYEYKLGKTTMEVAKNTELAFGEGSPNIKTVQHWFAKFKAGDFSLKNESRGKSENVFNTDVLGDTIEKNPQQITRCGNWFDSMYDVLKMLRMIKVSFLKMTFHVHQPNSKFGVRFLKNKSSKSFFE